MFLGAFEMGSFSVWHWLIVLAVVLLVFGGRGKISSLMGDFGKGLSAFKKGVGASDEPVSAQAGQPGDAAKPITAQTSTTPPAGQIHQDGVAKV
jgi:sec-independent protein translocase protein TatA